MKLWSIKDLRGHRKRLVKLLGADLVAEKPRTDELDVQIFPLGREIILKQIADIDEEITQRTGAPANDATAEKLNDR